LQLADASAAGEATRIDALKARLEAAEDGLRQGGQLADTIQRERQRTAALEAELRSTERRLESALLDVEASEKARASLSKSLEHVSRELEDVRRSYEDRIRTERRDAETRMSTITQTLSDAEARLAGSLADLQRHEANRAELETHLAEADLEIKSLYERIERERHASRARCDELEQHLQNTLQSLHAAEQDLVTQQNESADLLGELKREQAHSDSLQADLQQERLAAQGDAAELSQRLAAARSELDAERSRHTDTKLTLTRIEETREQLQISSDQLVSALDSERRHVRMLEQELQTTAELSERRLALVGELEQKIEQLRTDLSAQEQAARAHLHDAHNSASEVRRLKSELEAETSARQRAAEKAGMLEAQLVNAQQESQQRRQQGDDLAGSLEVRQRHIRRLEEECERLTRELASTRERATELETHLDKHRVSSAQESARLADCRRELAATAQDRETMRQTAEARFTELCRLEEELEASEARVGHLEGELASAHRELEQQATQHEQAMRAALQEASEQAQASIDTAHEERAIATSDLHRRLENECQASSQMEVRLAALHRDLDARDERIRSLERTLRETEEARRTAHESVSRLSIDLQARTSELASAGEVEKRLSEVHAKLRETTAASADLESKLQQVETARMRAEQESLQLRVRLDAALSEHDVLRSALIELEASTKAVDGDRRALEQLLEDERRKWRALVEDSKSGLARELQQAKDRARVLEQRCLEAEGECQRLQVSRRVADDAVHQLC
jgi:chromosome segregation ATPase